MPTTPLERQEESREQVRDRERGQNGQEEAATRAGQVVGAGLAWAATGGGQIGKFSAISGDRREILCFLGVWAVSREKLKDDQTAGVGQGTHVTSPPHAFRSSSPEEGGGPQKSSPDTRVPHGWLGPRHRLLARDVSSPRPSATRCFVTNTRVLAPGMHAGQPSNQNFDK